MEWFSWVVAVILLISSVISPWLVNKSNNEHQLKLKKLDMYEEAKRKALTDFIKACTNLRFNDSLGASDEFNRSINCLYLYFNDIPANIFSLEKSRNNGLDFSKELTKIVQDLSKQITKE